MPGWIGRDVRICGERADASGGVRGRVGVQLHGYGIVDDFGLYDRNGDYAGNLVFWPGSLVSVNKSVRVDAEVNNPVGAGLYGNALQVANQCSDYGTASPGGYTTCLASMTGHVGSGVQNQSATVLTDGRIGGRWAAAQQGAAEFLEHSIYGGAAAPHRNADRFAAGADASDVGVSIDMNIQTMRERGSRNRRWWFGSDGDFQQKVLDKLGRLEAKVDMIVGNGQRADEVGRRPARRAGEKRSSPSGV